MSALPVAFVLLVCDRAIFSRVDPEGGGGGGGVYLESYTREARFLTRWEEEEEEEFSTSGNWRGKHNSLKPPSD